MEVSIAKNKLKNIKISPLQDTKKLPFTLSGNDLAHVMDCNKATDLSISSKTYSLVSIGTPILCLAPKESALSKLDDSENIGGIFETNEIKEIENFVMKCLNSKEVFNKFSKIH